MTRPSLDPPTRTPRDGTGRAGVAALLGGVVFLGAFLAGGPLRGAVASQEMPLPNEPATVLLAYVRSEEPLALIMPALTHAVSMVGLAVFVLAVRRVARPEAGSPGRYGVPAAVAAIVAMVVSVALNVLEALAPGMPDGVLLGVHQAAFVAGGVAHVMVLGLAVALLGRLFASRAVRVLAVVAAVPALLSVFSLVWFYASALIPAGRVLSMVWVIVAAGALCARERSALR